MLPWKVVLICWMTLKFRPVKRVGNGLLGMAASELRATGMGGRESC